MSLYTNIIALCNQHGISPTALSNDIGISAAVFGRWRDGVNPQPRMLKKVADYFGITVEALTSEDLSQIKKAELQPLENVVFYQVPVFESVSAGFGALANENIVDYMPLPFRTESEAKESLVIKVKGDSMQPTICDGDFIQVRMQSSVDSGDLAVVYIDETEALVKKVDYGANYINLISLNPSYAPQVFSNADIQRVRVLGKVRKVIKIYD